MAGKKTDISELAAMAALGGATGLDNEMKELLRAALKEKLDETAKAREAELNWRKSNAEALNEARKEQRLERQLCPHRKEDQRTALAGQHIGKGQFCFVCLKCQQEFHKPAGPNQIEPPLALMPVDGVGGPAYA